jgi:hypothetical protein
VQKNKAAEKGRRNFFKKVRKEIKSLEDSE